MHPFAALAQKRSAVLRRHGVGGTKKIPPAEFLEALEGRI